MGGQVVKATGGVRIMTDHEELKKVIKEAINEAFIDLGINPAENFQTREDMLFLKKMRRGTENIKESLMKAGAWTILCGALYLIWEAIKNEVKK